MKENNSDEDLEASLAVLVYFRTKICAIAPMGGRKFLHAISPRNFVFRASCDSSKCSQLQTVCRTSQGFHLDPVMEEEGNPWMENPIVQADLMPESLN